MGSSVAHLVLREFGLSPSTNDGKVVGLAQHFDYPNASVEVYTVSLCIPSEILWVTHLLTP